MAKLSSDGTYVIVEKGDNLWNISKIYYGGGSNYKKLANLNNIPNPNLIYVGQKIVIKGTTSSSSSSSSSNKPTVSMGLQSNAENTLLATWKWSKSNTESYKILWTYDLGDGVELIGNNSSITVEDDYPDLARVSTYQIPTGARKVYFKVKPVSKYKDEEKKTYYWEANWSNKISYTDSTPLETPSAPTASADKYQLTMSLEGIESSIKYVQFQISKNDESPFHTSKYNPVSATGVASYTYKVAAGAEYKVRCRYWNSSSEVSDWSPYSTGVKTIPNTPSGITTIKANSETSVYLAWDKASSATSYDIEYTTKKDYFDGSDETTTKTGVETLHFEITGLETGTEYFFRIRAVNEAGESAWSDIRSVVIGKIPIAPTTWSSTTTAVTGDQVTLYWVHNTADGSSQTGAELEIYIDGFKEIVTKDYGDLSDEDKDKTATHVIDTSDYIEGTTIQWCVRTKGIVNAYGDWSIRRTIDVYAPPTLELNITDINEEPIETLTTFPFYVYGLAGPSTQTPTGYQLTISANSIYETVDNIGNVTVINKGDQVYSKHFDIADALLVELSANNINLENNISYTVTCVVSMSSGLTAEASAEFTVSWTDEQYVPNAEIGIDLDSVTATIRPYCDEYTTVYYEVDSSEYTLTDEVVDETTLESVYTTTGEEVLIGLDGDIERYYCMYWVEGVLVPEIRRVNYSGGNYVRSTVKMESTPPGLYTTTGERIYLGIREDGVEIYYSIISDRTLVDGITLSVYRREFDGSFTEIATGLDNSRNTCVIDPHPALDYARYRIVAIANDTGAISYYDMPAHSVDEQSVIIQWNEKWTSFDVSSDYEMEQPPWSGSLLRLPYDIDVQESYSPDVSHVAYAGRKHPVSYYGTQLGEAGNWSVSVPKSDKETLYALRRLAKWMGDVYVREPSGIGYWASVTVSFGQTHMDPVVPVTIDVKRVEGGM